jgi:hypothetical protein
MAFDWESFLDHNSVEIGRRRGRNVGIKCPWCHDDPSFHLSISLDGRGYHCWRDETHVGKSPVKLITALTGCSFEQAAAIARQEDVPMPTTDQSFASTMLPQLGQRTQLVHHQRKLELLPEFRDVTDRGLCCMLVLPYLRKRGYDSQDAVRLAKRFSLKYATTGAFAYRIIIPVYVDDRLVTWTSRTFADSELRYMTLSHDPERAAKRGLPAATKNIKECLFDYDEILDGGRVLVVTEGPFDAMRITFLGEKHGVRGTCLFSKSALPEQIQLIRDAADHYDEVVTLMDYEVGLGAFSMFPDSVRAKTLQLPRGVGDPAKLDQTEFQALFGISV